jgi:hypothetical protein
MSDPTTHGHHGGTEYEREDLTARSVFTFLIGLAVMGVLVFGFLKLMIGALESYNRNHQPKQNPLVTKSVPVPESTTADKSRQGIEGVFPKPRLEEDEIHELREFRNGEEKRLATYGWEDPNASTVHIPIERAMQLIVERGLPTQVKAGVVPPSPVNTAREAAVKADNSGKAKKKK